MAAATSDQQILDVVCEALPDYNSEFNDSRRGSGATLDNAIGGHLAIKGKRVLSADLKKVAGPDDRQPSRW
jgi:hypothetical protein